MVQDQRGATSQGSSLPALPGVPPSVSAPIDGLNEDVDVLFHLGLRVARSPGSGRCPPGTDDVVGLFRAVTHAVLCGSGSRARALAAAFAGPAGEGLLDLTRTDRYALFRTAGGRVVVASHGIGRPSVSVVLNELTKLFRYARAGDSQATEGAGDGRRGVDSGTLDLPPVTYYRVGTCGGIGVPAGSLVLTSRVVDGQLRGEATTTVLGVPRSEPAVFDDRVVAALAAYARTVDWGGGGKADGRAGAPDAVNRVVVGTTATLDGFYEEQGRMDGASCSFDDAHRTAWLRTAYDVGVRNFEVRMCMPAAIRARKTRVGGVLRGGQFGRPCSTALRRNVSHSVVQAGSERKLRGPLARSVTTSRDRNAHFPSPHNHTTTHLPPCLLVGRFSISVQMEGLEFAAFTHRHSIPAAMACVALINRLDGDQVSSPPAVLAAWEADLIRLIVGFVRHRLEGEAAGATEVGAS